MRPVFFYAASMVLFGSIGAVVRLLALPASEIAMFRGLFGSLCLVPFFLRGDRHGFARKLRRNGRVLLLSGLALAGNWVLLFEAFRRTSIAIAALCYYTAPVLVAAASPFLLGEKPSAKNLAATSVTFLGLVLVSGGQPGGSGASRHLAGALFGFGAALCYASLIVMNKFVAEMDGLETTLPQLSLATGVLALYVAASGAYRPFPPLGRQAALLLIFGVVHTGLGFLLFFLGIKGLKAQRIALLSYLDPMVSIAISLLAFGEKLAPAQALGAFCIVGSLLFATLGGKEPGSPEHPRTSESSSESG
jgi:drug/metabolite transporter (DMT)-like permease